MSNVTVLSENVILVNVPSGVVTGTTIGVSFQNPNQVVVSVANLTVTDATLSNNLPTYPSTKFEIYPNPTSNGEFRIENLELRIENVLTIYNAQGSVVYTQQIVSESTQVNANLTKGIYLVKVGNSVSKLIVD